MPLLSWLSRVSHTATSGTLVTPSVMIMMPVTRMRRRAQNDDRLSAGIFTQQPCLSTRDVAAQQGEQNASDVKEIDSQPDIPP